MRPLLLRPLHLLIATLSGAAVFCSPAFCSSPGQSASAVLTTDVDLVILTASAAVESGVASLDASRDSVNWDPPLLVVAQEKHAANWIVEHLLLEQMLVRGTQTVVDSALSTSATRLAYRIVDLNIRGYSGLIGSSASRECRITIALRLSDEGDGAVLWQHESDGHRQDRVPKTQLEALSNEDYNFADIELEQRSWGRIAEPAIVSGVLGSVVYFFFSNR